MCTQSFYYSASKFSNFIQGKSPLLQYLSSCLFAKGDVKNLSKVVLLSWNGPTVYVCCFMLAPRASTKKFVSRIHIR